MAETDAAAPCPECLAGLRQHRLRLHSQMQRQLGRRMVCIDRWYHDCERCGDAAVFCTVRVWPLGQQAPDPTPPQDQYDWPTDSFAAVVVAPQEVPMPDLSLSARPRDPDSSIPALSEAQRAKMAAGRPAPETLAYVLNALRNWGADGTGARP